MSGIGGGLMMVPGPWSAVGAALLAGGQVATQVGAATDRREAENERMEQTNQPTAIEPEVADPSRTAQGNASTPMGSASTRPVNREQLQAQVADGSIFQQQTGLGGYQSQIDAGIANLILGNGSGGV